MQPVARWPGPRLDILARPGHGTARPEAPGRAWAATVACGTAQARPDGPVLNGPVKKYSFLILKKENIGLLAHPSILIGLLINVAY